MADLRDLLKATLDEIVYGKRKPQPAPTPVDPNRPWDDPSLRAAPVQPQAVQAQPAQTPWLDPFEEALRQAERQEYIRRLTAPVTPVLDVTAVAPKLKARAVR